MVWATPLMGTANDVADEWVIKVITAVATIEAKSAEPVIEKPMKGTLV